MTLYFAHMALRRVRKRYRKEALTFRKKTSKPLTSNSEGKPTSSATFDITKIDVKKEKIPQPQAAKQGILPEHPFRMYVVGASGSGKSNFILNLLTRENMYKDYFDSIIVISPTAAHLDPNYKVLGLPETNFFAPDEKVLERVMEIQEKQVEDGGKTNSSKTLILLDDIISYKQFCNSSILLKFAVMSRHWNISMVVLSQAYHRIAKSIRLQMSCIIYFKGSNKELEVMTEDFGAPGTTKKQFMQLIQEATNERYSFFFIDLHRPIEKGRYRQNLTEFLLTSQFSS